MTLEELQQKVVEFRDERGWRKYHDPKEVAISLVLEAAELLHHFQWKDLKQQKDYVAKHKEEIADEIGDVLHNILLIAEEFNIDIESAFLEKLKKTEEKYPAK